MSMLQTSNTYHLIHIIQQSFYTVSEKFIVFHNSMKITQFSMPMQTRACNWVYYSSLSVMFSSAETCSCGFVAPLSACHTLRTVSLQMLEKLGQISCLVQYQWNGGVADSLLPELCSCFLYWGAERGSRCGNWARMTLAGHSL